MSNGSGPETLPQMAVHEEAVELGGGWREAAAAAAVGLVVGSIAIRAKRAAQTEPVVAPVAAIGFQPAARGGSHS
jgi:anti-sigma-K factor RskA